MLNIIRDWFKARDTTGLESAILAHLDRQVIPSDAREIAEACGYTGTYFVRQALAGLLEKRLIRRYTPWDGLEDLDAREFMTEEYCYLLASAPRRIVIGGEAFYVTMWWDVS